jgi:hypothetical protein
MASLELITNLKLIAGTGIKVDSNGVQADVVLKIATI